MQWPTLHSHLSSGGQPRHSQRQAKEDLTIARTRDQTLAEIAGGWQELQDVLNKVPPLRMSEPGLDGGWSVKDIVGHVTTWEAEMMRVVQSYIDTKDPSVMAYQDVDAFNERTTIEKRARLLPDLLDDLRKTHETTMKFVSSLDETLFNVSDVEKRIRVDLYDHYREHRVQVGQWLAETDG